jgi:predicted Zn-dependent protease
MHRLALSLAAVLLLSSCGGGGAPSGAPQIEEAERRLGAEQHPQLLAQFGGAYEGPEAAYVARVGERMAEAAGLGGQCRFTLVNTDVVNAFAVPGCYIYMTRGLMGLVNSEDELASVLAHEVGHIVGDHSERQQRRSVLRGLGAAAVGLITGSERLSQLAFQAAELFGLRYSRAQEYESDDLGIRYMRSAGYDPHAAADMLQALARQERFMAGAAEDASGIPEWARTHPLTENRIERASETAARTGVADGQIAEREEPYLTELDGLLYGDDPAQGFVLGRSFSHPDMRIAFSAPAGFSLINTPRAVLIGGPEGVRGEFGGVGFQGGLDDYVSALLRQIVGNAPAQVGTAQAGEVNGVPALFVPVQVQAQGGTASLQIAAYRGRTPAEKFHFIMVSDGSGASGEAIGALFGSFRLLTPGQAASLNPRVIRTVRAEPGDTAETLASRMASDRPLDLFLTLNGRTRAQPIRPGELVKIVANATR